MIIDKKLIIVMAFVLLLLVQAVSVVALTSDEAEKAWKESKKKSKDAQDTHREAKVDFAVNKSETNKKAVVDTGKAALKAALDEAEAWLKWKKADANENTEVPKYLKDTIILDVDKNLAKIELLRNDVENVKTQFELGIVFLKMIGKYFEVLADVARNVGAVWVYLGETRADKISSYETKLREAAKSISNNEDIIAKLDDAKKELGIAKRNIANAKDTYKLVKIPGTPLIKFSEGNNYLKAAKSNLLAAHGHLNKAFIKLNAAGTMGGE